MNLLPSALFHAILRQAWIEMSPPTSVSPVSDGWTRMKPRPLSAAPLAMSGDMHPLAGDRRRS